MGLKKYSRKLKKWISKQDEIKEEIKEQFNKKRPFIEMRIMVFFRDTLEMPEKLAKAAAKGALDEVVDFVKSIT